MKPNDPVGIGGVINTILGNLGLAPVSVQRRLSEDWESLAGDPWSGCSRPVVLRDGELLVEVKTPLHRSTLGFGTGELAERINRLLGAEMVTSVRLVVNQQN